MKAKKPLVLIVLAVALLAVALILPATAVAANGSQPVAWASFGGTVHNPGYLGQQAVLVQAYGDGSLRGHVSLQTIKPSGDRIILSGNTFFPYDPGGLGEGDFAFGVVVNGLVWGENGPEHIGPIGVLLYVLHDGGPAAEDWVTIEGIFAEHAPQTGNVTVHVQ